MVLNDLLREFVTLFVSIDPIGTIPVFLFAAATVPPTMHRRFALRAVLVAAGILLFFLVGGQVLLDAMGLRLGTFQIAGGLVLFLFALTMIFGESKADAEIEEAQQDHMAGAVYPLAIPSIASPGAILSVVILTDNNSNSVIEQAGVGLLLLAVLIITFVLLLLAGRIHRLIGNAGASVISRVMGLILSTVAVDAVLEGLEHLGLLSPSTPL